MMKIAVTGKGGVGKTTITSLLCYFLQSQVHRIIAIDADPDANLGEALGFSAEAIALSKPLANMQALARARTGAGDMPGSLFKLNPEVGDLLERYSLYRDGIHLVRLGTVDKGGSGCVCPLHALLRSFLRHLFLQEDAIIIMDMEAGIEHLGRGTTALMDALIIVVEPGMRSLNTGKTIERLAQDLGITKIFYLANKVGSHKDRIFLEKALPPSSLLGMVAFNEGLRAYDDHIPYPKVIDQHLNEVMTSIVFQLQQQLKGDRNVSEPSVVSTEQ